MWWEDPRLLAAAIAYAVGMTTYLIYRWRTR